MPHERSPIDIYLGALNVVAEPLLQNDRSEDFSEMAQFYGYEDFGEHFKNVSPRITQLEAHRPNAESPGCVITITTPRFLWPGAFTRATQRWAKSRRFTQTGPHEWRGRGMVLTLTTKRRVGEISARAVLSKEET